MTIKSIDMQVLIPKVNEVSRVQHIQQQANTNQQQELAAQLAQATVKNETSVNELPAGEKAVIRDKPGEEKDRNKSGKKDKRKNIANKDKEGDNKTLVGRNIDVTA